MGGRLATWLVSMALVACGSDVLVSEPAPEASVTTTGATSSASGTTAGGAAPTTSSATAGGAGGEDPGCAELVCDYPCPGGDHWLDADGCPTCACVAELWMPSIVAPPLQEHMSLSTTLTVLSDRYVFDFLWSYDDPLYDDEGVYVETTIELLRTDPSFEPSEEPVTWFIPEHADDPVVFHEATYAGYWVFPPPTTIQASEGFLSIRRAADAFEGYVRFGAGFASGPFLVELP